MSFFDSIVDTVVHSAEKVATEATHAAQDIAKGDIVSAAEHIENIREVPQETAVDIVKTTINEIV